MDKKATAAVLIVAIIAIAILEGMALHRGIDGTLFVPAVAAITALAAGFAGFTVHDIFPGKRR